MNDTRHIPTQYDLPERGDPAGEAGGSQIANAKALCPIDGVSAPCGQPCGSCNRRGRMAEYLAGGF